LISDSLKEIIEDLINGKFVLEEYIDLLSEKDQQIFSEILKIAHIDKIIRFESTDYFFA